MKIIQLAIRTLCRFKIYTIINIIGLALSMACVIIIFRYAEQELTVNSYIPDYSVVVGNPAVVVKYYDFKRKEWVKKDHTTI